MTTTGYDPTVSRLIDKLARTLFSLEAYLDEEDRGDEVLDRFADGYPFHDCLEEIAYSVAVWRSRYEQDAPTARKAPNQ